MRVTILTEAGNGIGYGHLARTTALADGFEQAGCTIQFLIRGSGADYPFNRKFRVIYHDWLAQPGSALTEDACDIVIVDSYHLDHRFMKELNKKSFLPVLLADSSIQFKPTTGHILFPSIAAKNFQHELSQYDNVLAGSEYLLYTKEFWNTENKPTSRKIKTVGISLGSATGNLLEPLMKVLLSSGFHSQQVSVFGVEQNKFLFLKERPIFHGFLSRNEYVKQILDTELLITNGGQTLNEAILLGIPNLSLICADNQENNARYWQSKMCTLNIDVRNGVNENELNLCIKELLNYQKRVDLNRNCMNAVDHLGAIRAAESIIQWKINTASG